MVGDWAEWRVKEEARRGLALWWELQVGSWFHPRPKGHSSHWESRWWVFNWALRNNPYNHPSLPCLCSAPAPAWFWGCIFLSSAFSFRRYIHHQERCIPKQGAPLQGPMPSHIHFGCVSEFSSWGSDREPFALTTLSQRNHSQKQKGGKNVTLKRKVNPPTYSHMDS